MTAAPPDTAEAELIFRLPEQHIQLAEQHTDPKDKAMRQIAEWENTYSLAAYPEPDTAYFNQANAVLAANGLSLDLIYVSAMRHGFAVARLLATNPQK